MKNLTDFRKTLETGLGPRLRRVTIFLFDETIALFYQYSHVFSEEFFTLLQSEDSNRVTVVWKMK